MTTTLEPAPPEAPDWEPRRRRAPEIGPAWRAARRRFAGEGMAAQAGRYVALFVVFAVFIEVLFHSVLSTAYLVDGIALGSLYGIVGVALILIYRTNRIINFAAAAVGAVPAITALLLDVAHGVSFLAVMPIALFGGALFGALTDLLVIRRFSKSPRLILSVVTVGVAQGFGALGFFIPVWMGVRAGEIPTVPTPWEHWKILNGRGQPLLTGNQVAALVVVVVMAVLLALFLRYTRIGIALRASAENADRASLLGIPVKRVQTVAWILAGALAGMAILVQAPLIGVPQDASLGFKTLLYGLTAAVVARMERIGLALAAGLGIGVIIFGAVAKYGSDDYASALMLIVILVALLVQRGALSRAYDAGTSTWESVKMFRPIPVELRAQREVVIARIALFAASVAVVVIVPFVIGKPNIPDLIVLPIFGIVAVSLVILTGWAGQISLGQFGIVAAGALVAGGLAANHNIEFFEAVAIGVAAGVVVSVIIGLPAVRIQGLYLAVTTLAFAYAMVSYVLNTHYPIGRHLMPSGFTAHLDRPVLYGRINLENDRTFYFTCVAFLAVAMLVAFSFRKNRSGRVLIAARDNQRAAPSYAINLVRARLAAFAVSGGIAGMAGVLFAYAQHNVIPGSYRVENSIAIFLATVIGGLTSVPWAVVGAVSVEALTLFGPRLQHVLGETLTSVLPLLALGPLLILNLYFYPGGTAEANFKLRDKFLRWVAKRHDILVPSLVADRRVETGEADTELIEGAEQSVVEAEGFDVLSEPAVTCPVCGQTLSLEEAPEHEHLRVDAGSV